MKVLLVDDSKFVFKVVNQILSKDGHEVIWAEDGLHAIKILSEQNDFKIILLDWNMPNLNGPGFLERNAKEKITETPVVMMTTEDKLENMQYALSHGAVEYITKPFTDEILNEKIEMVLDT